MENVVVSVRGPVDTLPLVAVPAVQPPVAVHDVALDDVQVIVEVPPLGTEVGLAKTVTVGASPFETVTVTEASAPVAGSVTVISGNPGEMPLTVPAVTEARVLSEEVQERPGGVGTAVPEPSVAETTRSMLFPTCTLGAGGDRWSTGAALVTATVAGLLMPGA